MSNKFTDIPNNRICYHHNDMDGRGAAYCLLRYLIREPNVSSKIFHEMDYTKKLDAENCENKYVYILDLAFSKDTINQILDVCKVAKRVIWIDHHQTSLDVVNANKEEFDKIEKLNYFLSNKASGALLTYLYIKADLNLRNNIREIDFDVELDDNNMATMPNNIYDNKIFVHNYLKYIDDYDRWVKKYNPETDLFINGTKICNTKLHKDNNRVNPFWSKFTNNNSTYTEELIKAGKIITEFLNIKYESELKADSYESTVDGIKFLCMNGHGNSFVFGDRIHDYDAVVLYKFSGRNDKYNYSIYSDANRPTRLNCQKFAEKYGGGGHVGAAGFSTEELLFKPDGVK